VVCVRFLTKGTYFCIDYLRENLSNSYEVAESIEIVNISGVNRSDFSENKGKDEVLEEDKINTSKGDWTDTYKEIFESKELFVIKGILGV
jgi:hypothetical protein